LDPAALRSGPPPPSEWTAVLDGVEKANVDFRALIDSYSDADLMQEVSFFVAPKTMGNIKRIQVLWFLLSDQIHHRGQFSISSWPPALNLVHSFGADAARLPRRRGAL
jgi:hypothetical protein